MLTMNETVEKLHSQPARFEQCIKDGEYCRAKWCFISTVFVSDFIELDKKAEDRLFELFPEERVREVFRKAGGPDDTGCRPKKEADAAG